MYVFLRDIQTPGLVFDLEGLTLDGIHLKQCVTLYLFSLPFTLVKELGWATVPIITVVAFTFMGIEGIAEQIEMPFGKHACYRYMANKLIDFVKVLMKLTSRWVGLRISWLTPSLFQCMTYRSLLLGFEGRDPVSNNPLFFSPSCFLTHIKVYHRKTPRGWCGQLWLGRRSRRRLIFWKKILTGYSIPASHISAIPYVKPT